MLLYPGERRARSLLAESIRRGRFPAPGACVLCAAPQGRHPGRPGRAGNPFVVWHHWNGYATDTAAFDVVALCTSCHWSVHHGLLIDPGSGRLWEQGPVSQFKVVVERTRGGPQHRWAPSRLRIAS